MLSLYEGHTITFVCHGLTKDLSFALRSGNGHFDDLACSPNNCLYFSPTKM